MLVQGNQQATASWIAGIIEGEGHFEKRDYNFFQVHISNCDLDIIKACSNFLNRHYILHTVYEELRKTKGGKTPYRILISSQDCKNLYTLLKPIIQCRLDQFQRIVGASETSCDATLVPDLNWLIGIWQAEGTFYISRRDADNCMVPYVSLENTNKKIIDKIKITLDSLWCAYYCKDFVPTVKKPYTRIQINGIKRLQRFLDRTKGLWIGDRDIKRSSLMLEYIESRLSKPKGIEYSEREKQIYWLMKDQNV